MYRKDTEILRLELDVEIELKLSSFLSFHLVMIFVISEGDLN